MALLRGVQRDLVRAANGRAVDEPAPNSFSQRAQIALTESAHRDRPARRDRARRVPRLAEETGLIVPIGTWVLNESCRLAQKWQAERAEDEPLVVRVNVSARELAQDDLIDLVVAALQRTGMDPSHLALEVTESVLVEDPSRRSRRSALSSSSASRSPSTTSAPATRRSSTCGPSPSTV
jgi:hypothetical protein